MRAYDIPELWPELFEELSVAQYETAIEVMANNVLEGWEPTREVVELLLRRVRGEIDGPTYRELVVQRVQGVAVG